MPLLPSPPVSPVVVVRGFEPSAHDWLPAHRGVDLRAGPGQPVRSPARGAVVFTGRVAGRPVVSIRARGLRLTFEPVAATVPAATAVRPGTVLGAVSTGGHCSGRCVHFGVKSGGRYLDPMALLGGGVVLKPAPTSGAGVGGAVGLSQPLGRDMRIDLRAGQAGVTQHLLHVAEVGAAGQ